MQLTKAQGPLLARENRACVPEKAAPMLLRHGRRLRHYADIGRLPVTLETDESVHIWYLDYVFVFRNRLLA